MNKDSKTKMSNVVACIFMLLNPVLIYMLVFFIERNSKMVLLDFNSRLHFFISILLFLVLGILIGFINYMYLFFYQKSYSLILVFQMVAILIILISYLLNPSFAKIMDGYTGKTATTSAALMGNIIFLTFILKKIGRKHI